MSSYVLIKVALYDPANLLPSLQLAWHVGRRARAPDAVPQHTANTGLRRESGKRKSVSQEKEA